MRRLLAVGVSFGFLLSLVVGEATSQDAAKSAGQAKKKSRLRGSLIEDRAAKKLVEAGDARLEAQALRLGGFFLDRDRAYDKARAHFEATASEDNRDEDQRAEATLKVGVCFYQARNFGKCFSVMRDVI